jgi:hypothetical protein
VGVAERGQRLRFSLESLLEIGIVSEMPGKKLDGDGATETGIPSLEDFAHPSGAQRLGDLVRTKLIARLQLAIDGLTATGGHVSPRRQRRLLRKAPRLFVCEEERLDFGAQRSIISARLGQERRPRFGASRER